MRASTSCVRARAGDSTFADTRRPSQWTHLIGSLIATSTLIYALLQIVGVQEESRARVGWWAPFTLVYPFATAAQPSVTWRDTAGFISFFSSAAICLGAPVLLLLVASELTRGIQASRRRSTPSRRIQWPSRTPGTGWTTSASSSLSQGRSSRASATASSAPKPCSTSTLPVSSSPAPVRRPPERPESSLTGRTFRSNDHGRDISPCEDTGVQKVQDLGVHGAWAVSRVSSWSRRVAIWREHPAQIRRTPGS